MANMGYMGTKLLIILMLDGAVLNLLGPVARVRRYIRTGLCLYDKAIHSVKNHPAVMFVQRVANKIYGNKYCTCNDVCIETGVVRGYKAEDGDYMAYLGIPYAAPPIGNLRYKVPQPPEPWCDIFHAKRLVKSAQKGEGNEDCLILNVFTPTTIKNAPLPVLVYIHGGAYVIGAAQTRGAEPLIKENVILVTVNYRLGAPGFLCLGVNEAPGNCGLRDQIAALKWVQNNIEGFYGDRNQVTLYGTSAGGTSVDLLIMSNLTKGLYNNAIIESGSAALVWSVDATPVKTAVECAKLFGVNEPNLFRLLDHYRKVPADKLSAVTYKLYEKLTNGTFGFAPALENPLCSIEPVMTQSPLDIMRCQTYNKVPMMFIFSSLEGLFLKSTNYHELNFKDRMNKKFQDFMPIDLVFDNENIKQEVTKCVKKFYFGDKAVGDKTLMEYLNFFGDSCIMHGLLNSAISYAKDGNVVYLMEFAYKSELGSYEKFYEHIKIAGHGDAVKHVILNKPAKSESDKVVVNKMAKIVANFVKYSVPIPCQSEMFPILWPAVHPDWVTYLHFEKTFQLLDWPIWERKLFWDQLYDAYRKEIEPFNIGCSMQY